MPPTYSSRQRAEVVAIILSDPQSLGFSFVCGLMDRLQVDLGEEKTLAVKRRCISETFVEEGPRWRKQETWFGSESIPTFPN